MQMTAYQVNISCPTENDTRLLAEKLAKIARKGDVFALFGTLGAGKSTFSRYFIQCLTNAEEIPSPTFTLLQTYDALLFEIYHYDMYRLKSPEEAFELGIEESFYSGVNLVEWPEKIAPLLPKNIWKVTITTKDSCRFFNIETTDEDKIIRAKELFFE